MNQDKEAIFTNESASTALRMIDEDRTLVARHDDFDEGFFIKVNNDGYLAETKHRKVTGVPGYVLLAKDGWSVYKT